VCFFCGGLGGELNNKTERAILQHKFITEAGSAVSLVNLIDNCKAIVQSRGYSVADEEDAETEEKHDDLATVTKVCVIGFECVTALLLNEDQSTLEEAGNDLGTVRVNHFTDDNSLEGTVRGPISYGNTMESGSLADRRFEKIAASLPKTISVESLDTGSASEKSPTARRGPVPQPLIPGLRIGRLNVYKVCQHRRVPWSMIGAGTAIATKSSFVANEIRPLTQGPR
jgi:hypothetical protein